MEVKRTMLFFIVLVFVTYFLGDFNNRVGITPLTIVLNTTYLLTIVYASTMVSVKDIQELMDKQKKIDRQATATKSGD